MTKMNLNEIILPILSIFLIFILMSSLVVSVPTSEEKNDIYYESMSAYDIPIDDFFIPEDYRPMGYVPEGSATYTNDFMFGDVSVVVIFMESNGAIDEDTEDWSNEDEDYPGVDRKEMVMSKIQDGLNWWAEREPRAHLTWTFHEFETGENYTIISTSYEPITRPSWDQKLWVTEAMDYFGYTSEPYYVDNVRVFDDDIRNADGTDWAFTIFVVDSLNDLDGKFANNKIAVACSNGPHLMMTYDNGGNCIKNMNAILAHETGHIFGATDQYENAPACNEASDCSKLYGYLHVENQNCEIAACLMDVSSIMKHSVDAYENGDVDTYGRGQVGWRDADEDDILDVIDADYPDWYGYPRSDSDGDGIIDYWDDCPNTPGIPERMGCPSGGGGGGCGLWWNRKCMMAW